MKFKEKSFGFLSLNFYPSAKDNMLILGVKSSFLASKTAMYKNCTKTFRNNIDMVENH